MTKITGRAKFYKEKDEWKMSVLGRNFFLNQCLTYLKKKDETEFEVQISLVRITSKKTKAQLGYLFGALYPALLLLIKETGYRNIDIAGVDAMMRMKYLTEEFINEETGEVIQIPIQLEDIGKDEMTEYIDKLIQLEFIENYGMQPPTAKKYSEESLKTS